MKTDSSFHNITEDDGIGPKLVPVEFDGQEFMLPEETNLAASLLAAGIRVFRESAVSGSPRGPNCMMGVCYDCLVEVDGVVQQSCQLQVQAGMKVAMPPLPAGVAKNKE